MLASVTQTWTGNGDHGFYVMSLDGIGKSNSTSNYSVVCTIPGNGQGFITEIILFENQ
jgi:hypothetical protein